MTKEFLHEVVARREGTSSGRRPRFSEVMDEMIRSQREREVEATQYTPPYSYATTSSGTYGTVTMGHTITAPVVDDLRRYQPVEVPPPNAPVDINGRLVNPRAGNTRVGQRTSLAIETYPSVGIAGRIETVTRGGGVIHFDCPPNHSRRRNNVRIGNLPSSMLGLDSFRTLARQALAMLIDHGCLPDYNLVVRETVGDSIQTTFECASCAIHITIGE